MKCLCRLLSWLSKICTCTLGCSKLMMSLMEEVSLSYTWTISRHSKGLGKNLSLNNLPNKSSVCSRNASIEKPLFPIKLCIETGPNSSSPSAGVVVLLKRHLTANRIKFQAPVFPSLLNLMAMLNLSVRLINLQLLSSLMLVVFSLNKVYPIWICEHSVTP